MPNKTALYDTHLAMGAKMVDFHGWALPIHYGSQLEEHHAVRRDAGMFDVSHMTIIDLHGGALRPFLRHLLANNVDRQKTAGKALYSCMLNEQGGIIDDLIIYYIDESRFRMVINAATRDRGLGWIRQQAQAFEVGIKARDDLAMIAVQGPRARAQVHKLLGVHAEHLTPLTPFTSTFAGDMFVARTGYTGEDGYEIILPAENITGIWTGLYQLGVKPIGLGARDTLRLEAGLNLSGTDMDETTSPLESGLEWTIAWEPEDRAFIGRAAITPHRHTPPAMKLVGLLLHEKGVLRNGQKVFTDTGKEGIITSGGFSPTLGRAIALARVPSEAEMTCKVEIRGKRHSASIVRPPFVRHGKSCITEINNDLTT
ncbi:MAG: glycine cleavage system protein T [Gammaproteobacteria bacterium RBG_16_57_12]|nr:MAG: glycine cleavage system protein T [Gammaproteobacteria bacterium RBG_16_57_12]